MPKNPRLRKCQRCKQYFDIFENDFIKENGRFFDVKCYKEKELYKGIDPEITEKAIEVFLEQSNIERKQKEQELLEKAENSLRSKQQETNRAEYKALFIDYLKETYNVMELPKSLYSKLAQINSGNFKNYKIAIPYEDLLDMFKRKQKFLSKLYANNVAKGKEMTAIQRINYDISVIIGKYEDYLKWKSNQKLLENEINNNNNEIKVDYTKLNNTVKNVENETDILSILDDLY